MTENSAAKFDRSRAGEYARQSRIGLAGYDACHELSACMLSAAIGAGKPARLLIVGAGGTAGEIIEAARLEPEWRFVAVDPSEPMMELARSYLAEADLSDRIEIVLGSVSDIGPDEPFDAAIMIGVLHHLPGDAAKRDILAEISTRLKPDAPLVIAGNYRSYASEPLLMAAWANRWRLHGETPDVVEQKMGRLIQGAEPPQSEEAVLALLAEAGFVGPVRFFASLFWGAWLARRENAGA
ncbi:methyltransferase [Martelella radicis]|uniref:tRNA (Cmo5U34)-methyltransferase n=1 Tax=Martelella radicis TaxID=1397476 RepID=A0A7W6KG55_9HYPH|nr:tRNA (cmo5U34)-methyltransferase [Martelella radicis]